MKKLLLLAVTLAASYVGAQTHDLKPADALGHLNFMVGNWVGKQDFNTGGAPMVGEATNHVEFVIGGRYIEERLSTVLPGRKPTDTRHLITFDPKSAKYRAWWFNDTTVAPTEFEGELSGTQLVLVSKPSANGTVMRATYAAPGPKALTFKLEMKQGEKWQLLFTSSYKQ